MSAWTVELDRLEARLDACDELLADPAAFVAALEAPGSTPAALERFSVPDGLGRPDAREGERAEALLARAAAATTALESARDATFAELRRIPRPAPPTGPRNRIDFSG